MKKAMANNFIYLVTSPVAGSCQLLASDDTGRHRSAPDDIAVTAAPLVTGKTGQNQAVLSEKYFFSSIAAIFESELKNKISVSKYTLYRHNWDNEFKTRSGYVIERGNILKKHKKKLLYIVDNK